MEIPTWLFLAGAVAAGLIVALASMFGLGRLYRKLTDRPRAED